MNFLLLLSNWVIRILFGLELLLRVVPRELLNFVTICTNHGDNISSILLQSEWALSSRWFAKWAASWFPAGLFSWDYQTTRRKKRFMKIMRLKTEKRWKSNARNWKCKRKFSSRIFSDFLIISRRFSTIFLHYESSNKPSSAPDKEEKMIRIMLMEINGLALSPFIERYAFWLFF